MKQCVEGRELITMDVEGSPVHCTYHGPPDPYKSGPDDGRVGVLFLNSLSLPRAATGDSAVYWADALAACGYPSFRIDLPGLGDSGGDLPRELLDFINSGGFARQAAQSAWELVDRFHLSGIIIAGHCAGAVSALYAAAGSTTCRGLVLLDVYFHLPQAVRPKVRRKLSDWALKSRTGKALSSVYHTMKKVRLLLRGDRPPENANFRLLSRWDEISSTGLPILVLKAPARRAIGTKPRKGEFDYLAYILKRVKNRDQVTVKLTEGTDHSFANRLGRDAVRQHMEDWLRSYFPLPQQ